MYLFKCQYCSKDVERQINNPVASCFDCKKELAKERLIINLHRKRYGKNK